MGSKAIPAGRERVQGRWLGVVGGMLAALLFIVFKPVASGGTGQLFLIKCFGIALTFASGVWALRAATGGAALCGGLICVAITSATAQHSSAMLRSGLAPLLALFALTFVAGRMGRGRKERAGLAEGRGGRNAAQVMANLGMAGVVAMAVFISDRPPLDVMLLAALCEATADTVSSEIGQAFGGTPWMVTTFRRVAVGTDGGVSLLGSAAGVLGAMVVAGVGLWSLRLGVREAGIAFLGGVAGLVFDSVLGATVERRGWLGNDLVNFCSTGFAVGVAWGLMVVFGL